MADFSCPCCGANLRHRHQRLPERSWRQALHSLLRYSTTGPGGLWYCGTCRAPLREVVWPAGLAIRFGAVLIGAFTAGYMGYLQIPHAVLYAFPLPFLALLLELRELRVSKRPVFRLVEDAAHHPDQTHAPSAP